MVTGAASGIGAATAACHQSRRRGARLQARHSADETQAGGKHRQLDHSVGLRNSKKVHGLVTPGRISTCFLEISTNPARSRRRTDRVLSA